MRALPASVLALLGLWAAAAAAEPPAGACGPPLPAPLQPLFDRPQQRRAVAALRRGRPAEARRLASAALRAEPPPNAEQRAALRFVRALAAERAGGAPAAADWSALLDDTARPGLAAQAAWYRGQRLWRRGLAAGAAEAFELAGPYLERVAFPGRFGQQARLLRVRGLRAAGRAAAACALADETRRGLYRRPGEARAALALARCREHRGWAALRGGRRRQGRALLRRAVRGYARIATLWPERWAGAQAAAGRERLQRAGHQPAGQPAEPLLARARDILARPFGLRDRRRLWRVRTLLPWNLKQPAGAEAELLWAEQCFRLRRFRQAWRSASRVERAAVAAELRARAGLLLGRLTARRRSAAAIEVYQRVWRRWPDAAAAAEARLRAAEILRRRGRAERAAELFAACIEAHPDSPAAASSRWGLGWAALRAGELERALGWLQPLAAGPAPQRAFEPDPAAADGRLQRRAAYWCGRIEQRLGHRDEAAQRYRALAAAQPLTYYAVLAALRLRQLGVPVVRADDSLRPGPAPLAALHAEVAAAVSLFRMGLEAEARIGLRHLRRADLRPLDRRWAARLRQRMGDYSRSHRLAPVPRDRGLPAYPRPGWRGDGRLAFPRAFAEQVEGPARDPRVPALLLYALMRAESGFWPRARSPAHARGLTQVITPTAWRVVRRLGIRGFRRWRLYQPQTAVRIGSAYLGQLIQRYGHAALAIAAYNAGETAVDRWLRRRGGLALDAFIEEIPYAETGRYTRRLLSWWAIYRALYRPPDEPLLELELELPKGRVFAAEP